VGSSSLIGIQAVVLNGARIGHNCLVGAGAVVTKARSSRRLADPGRAGEGGASSHPEQIERIRYGALHYVENAERHRRSLKRIA